MGQLSLLVVVCALSACGRIGFDPTASGEDGQDASTKDLADGSMDLDASDIDKSDAEPNSDATPMPACKFTCNYDYSTSTTDCGSGAITFQVLSPGDPSVLRVDMTNMDSLEAVINVCDPAGPYFQIADSRSNGLGKGDDGITSNDAHLLLSDTDIEFFRNDFGAGSQKVVDFVAAAGCSIRTIVVADQTIEAPNLSVNDATALRLDPATDLQGAPDRLWYLGINRTVDTTVENEGSGLEDVNFCLR